MNVSIKRIFSYSFIFWIIFAACALYFIIPLRKHIKFGIDLVGGTYITLDVNMEKAIEYELHDRLPAITNILKEGKVPLFTSQKTENNNLVLNFDNEQSAYSAQQILRDSMPDLKSTLTQNRLDLTFTNEKMIQIKRWALQSNIDVLNTRLKKIGVEEISVSSRGERSIIVELPDVNDPAQAKRIIGTPAMLEFKLVEKTAPTQEEILEEYGDTLPEEMEIVTDRDALKENKRYYLVSKYAQVTGRDLKDAVPVYGGQGFNSGMVVNFKLTPEGGRKFYELTSKNLQKTLAAILDGKVVSAATIQSEIHDQGSITGFDAQKAKEVAMLLKSGAFVAPVTFAEERRIGPSLGYESIKSGLLSCLIGMGLLFLFSVITYKFSGLLAFIALIYNLLLILVGLSIMGATLTLPGIAGMVLTVGMAIDASILIYERIRESLAAGANVPNAVQEGFSDAMVVILDANITTFLVGLVLFYFGTGPIKGFAVTMMIGIISTLITGLFFLRSMFTFILGTKKIQKLSI